MAQTLFDLYGGGLLYVLGNEELPIYQREDNIEIIRFIPESSNYLERALSFSHKLEFIIEDQRRSLEMCHFRDPWSGISILRHDHRNYAVIYEVNGLPSIELRDAYPDAAPGTLNKIRAQELYCWSGADRIITPSRTIKDNLIQLGCDKDKICIIRNGADVLPPSPRPSDAPKDYVIYFGAIQRWQGVDVALRAFARLQDYTDLWLVLCISAHRHSAKPYQRLAEKLGISNRILWLFRLGERDLAPWREHALLSVAPLTECPRNLEQGCCPLKILESMAAGVPVVASDLPSVREIIDDKINGRLVRPDRPADLARAIRIMIEYPQHRIEMGKNAREKIERELTWEFCTHSLSDLYREIRSEFSGPTEKDLGRPQAI